MKIENWIGNLDLVFRLEIRDYATACNTLIWRSCGCWITDRLTPTQSDNICGVGGVVSDRIYCHS